MSIKIYTKTGDAGTTSLIGGTKVPKSNQRIEAYGTIDELNSFLGLVGDLTRQAQEPTILSEIQDRLFTIGSSLACDPEKKPKLKIPDLFEADVTSLENEMDRMNFSLPDMKHFIIPGGHVSVSTIHIARCVCRRAERLCVLIQTEKKIIDPLIIKYLNRLSDYLFVLARFIGKNLKIEEIPWRPRLEKLD